MHSITFHLSRYLNLTSLTSVAFCFFLLGACQDDGREKEIKNLFTDLQQINAQVRDSVFEALEGKVLLRQDLPTLYEAIQADYPYDSLEVQKTRLRLLTFFREINDPEIPEQLGTLFRSSSKDSPLRPAILVLLAEINSPEAIIALRTLLLEYPEVGARNASKIFEPLLAAPQQLNHFFPAGISMLRDERLAYPMLEALSIALENQSLARDSITDHLGLIEEIYHNQKKVRAAHRKDSRAYVNANALMKVSLRCLSHWPNQQVSKTIFQEALQDPVFDTRFPALLVLIQKDDPLADSLLQSTAADFRYRTQLYESLEAEGWTSRFPTAYFKPDAFAEGDLARWLSQTDSKGDFPEELQQEMRYPYESEDEEDKTGTYYLFKYRYGNRWEAGLSGPQPLDSSTVLLLGPYTHSEFASWESKSPEEHMKTLLANYGIPMTPETIEE